MMSGPSLCLDLGGDDTLPSVRGREILNDEDVGDDEVLPMSAIAICRETPMCQL